jgi:hypothetical protein
MQQGRSVFLCRDEEMSGRHRDAVCDPAVKSLRSDILDRGRVLHSGDDSLDGVNRIVLERLDLRQPFEGAFGQIALPIAVGFVYVGVILDAWSRRVGRQMVCCPSVRFSTAISRRHSGRRSR